MNSPFAQPDPPMAEYTAFVILNLSVPTPSMNHPTPHQRLDHFLSKLPSSNNGIEIIAAYVDAIFPSV